MIHPQSLDAVGHGIKHFFAGRRLDGVVVSVLATGPGSNPADAMDF
jgi:hypothetical protein